MLRRSACSSARWRSIRNPSRRRAGWRARSWAACSNDMTDSAAADIARAEELVGASLGGIAPQLRLRISPKARCCARRTDVRRPFPNTRRRSRSIATCVSAFIALGWCKFFTGSMEEAIPLEEQAIRLSPRDPCIGYRYVRIGTVHLLQSRIDEAIVWLEKARSANPALPCARTPASPPPMRSKARPNAPPPNSPKPGG